MGMSVESTDAIGRAALFAWQVSANQEEPWRRFLQELSGPRFKEYAELRRRLGISAEAVYLEADNPEWAVRELVAELAAPDNSFDSWFRREMHELFGCDFTQLPRAARSELLFTWREASGEGKQEIPKGS
jgi:hypothetical protein